MARVEISDVVLRSAGSSVSTVAGASVQVNVRGGSAATVYVAETGGSTRSNPLTSDSAGRIEGWLEEGSYDLVVSGGSITTYTQPVEAASGASVASLESDVAEIQTQIGEGDLGLLVLSDERPVDPPVGTVRIGLPVVEAFSPLDIAGCQIWLKDTGIPGADDDQVETWTNDGAAADFTNATSLQQPIKKTGILNGHAVTRWDYTNKSLSAGDLSAAFPSAATLFVVYSPTSAQQTVYLAGAADAYWSYDGVGYMGAFRATRVNSYPAAMPASGTHRVCVVSDASAYEVFLDGVSQGAQAAGFTGGTSHKVGQGGANYGGDIAEIIAYDTALSEEDMDLVDAYLVEKFDL